MQEELIGRLALSLAIGLLVGLERGWRERDEPTHSRTAGIRTYGIAGLLGGICALLAQAMATAAILVAGFLAFAAILTLYKMREALSEHDYSVTAIVAGLAVFGLGALAVSGDQVLAAAGGAALAAVLASREFLHALLQRMKWEELRAALILAAMTTIVLPLLPNRTVDPWTSVNPREIWVFTILVAALSYAGYVATRLFGSRRGVVFGALFGAVVSSTAVTVALARRSQDMPTAMAGAAMLAAAVSIGRVCLVVAVAAPAVLAEVAAPALSAFAVFSILGALLLLRRAAGAPEPIAVRNPFEFLPLLGFAAGFAGIAAASAYLGGRIGATGMLATSAVSAVFDVDVAVLSAVRQIGTANPAVAVGGVAASVLLALLANAAGRASLAAVVGSWRFSGLYLGATLLAAAVGVAVHAS